MRRETAVDTNEGTRETEQRLRATSQRVESRRAGRHLHTESLERLSRQEQGQGRAGSLSKLESSKSRGVSAVMQ